MMSREAMGRSLDLKVRDFGPIYRASLQLRPLTVFIGASNTGKSYLASLIYALHKQLGANPGLEFYPRYGHLDRNLPVGLTENSLSEISQWVSELSNQFDELSSDPRTGMPKKRITRISLPNSLRKSIQSQFEAGAPSFNFQLRRCFGQEVGSLVRKGTASESRVAVSSKNPGGGKNFEHQFTFSRRKFDSKTTISRQVLLGPKGFEILEKISSIGKELAESGRTGEHGRQMLHYLIGHLLNLIYPDLVGILNSPAFYLPADRTGVMHSHRVIVSALIDRASMGGVRALDRTPALSGVLADFLEELISLETRPYRKTRSVGKRYAKRMEDDLLEGSVLEKMGEATKYPTFSYQPRGWTEDIPLMSASSMVSELAPIVLYLRHKVVAGDVMIVEEPESHLHPAMQVEFTRLLAQLVKSGIRVIVTTHSEWLLEELANIVRRSSVQKGQKNGVDKGRPSLSKDLVGAWLFKKKKNHMGSIIKEIELDDSGLYPSEFHEVAIELQNEWANISGSIED